MSTHPDYGGLFPLRVVTSITPYRERVRITVAQWAKRPDALIDSSAYLFNAEAHEMGLESWRVVDGVDPLVDGSAFDIWLASGRCISAQPGSAFLYVSEAHAAALAQASPEAQAARLQAAAPALLAALRHFVTDRGTLTERERKDLALAAIAQATGEAA